MSATPKRYTKKPVTIEAIQFVLGETTKGDILKFCPGANVGVPASDDEAERASTDIRWVEIETLEGSMTVSPDDFIIKGIQGEFYPCKPDIFHASYEEDTSYAGVYEDNAGEWRYTVWGGNHEIKDAAHEGYATKGNAKRALRDKYPGIQLRETK